MKLLFTYDTPELREIGTIIQMVSASDHIHILTVDEQGKKRNLYDVASDIRKETQHDNSFIIFINQYLACADIGYEWLQCNAGIALIKFLRMMEVKCHIVLISPFNELNLIKNNPGNLIVSTKGITVAKLLHEFFNKTITELENFSKNIFDDNQDLRPYVLTEFRLPEDERHNWANWWGIVQLTDVHRSLFPEELLIYAVDNKNYSGSIDKVLKQLKNVQALRLFRHKIDFKKAIEEEVLIRLKKQKRNLAFEIEKLNKQIEGTGKKNPKLDEWADFIKDREKIIEENLSNRKFDRSIFILQIEFARKALEEGKLLLASKEHELKETVNKLIAFQNRKFDVNEVFKMRILSYRFKQVERKPRILYIDDQAEEGWSDIFQIILFGDKTESFLTVSNCIGEIESLYIEIKNKIIVFNPDLVLLDLRLQKEIGVMHDVLELSGAKLLKRIREDYLGLPIMMVTASNKSWSHEQVLLLGCDAFWTKEGIDSNVNVYETINNYLRFVNTVFLLTGSEYSFLNWFSGEIEKIRSSKTSYWWETSKYAKDGKVNKNQIILVLSHTLMIIRNYLKLGLMNHVKQEENTLWLYPSLAIHNLGKILELIYNTWSLEYMYDKTAKQLYKKRNNASHIVQDYERITATDISFIDLIDFIKEIIQYLNLENKPPIGKVKRKSFDNVIITQEELRKNIRSSHRKKK